MSKILPPSPESQDDALDKYVGKRNKIFDAIIKDDLQFIKNVVRTEGLTLSSPELKDPETSVSALHHAILNSAKLVSEYLIESGEIELLTASFDNIVCDVTTKVTVLHQLAERGSIRVTKLFLSRITQKKEKMRFLNQMTLVQPKGQRPRQLSPLHIAALNGRNSMLKLFLNIGVDVNFKNNKQDTALLWAVRGGHLSVVKTLIQMHADVNHKNDKGSSPLHWAVRYGFTDIAKILIEKGKANVNMRRKLGLVSLVILASALGHEDIVSLLCANGADVNTKIHGAETALHYAAAEGYPEVIEVLLKHGSDINAQNENGDTPLMLAVKSKHTAAAELLCLSMADVHIMNRNDATVWHYAVQSPDSTTLKTLIKSIKNRPEFKTTKHRRQGMQGKDLANAMHFPVGKSPIFVTASKGDVDKMEELLDVGVDPEAKDELGNNYLHIAAQFNQSSIVMNFRDKGAIDSQNSDGDTAIHIACRLAHQDTVFALIQKNAKVDLQNNRGETALHIAAKFGAKEMVKGLVDYAIKTHNWSILDLMDEKGNTSLHVVAEAGNLDVVQFFSDSNIRTRNSDGDTALHLAAKSGNPTMVQMLLDIFQSPGRTVDVNIRNHEGSTALDICILHGNKDNVTSIIQLGGDLSNQDEDGNTALHKVTFATLEEPKKVDTYLEIFETLASESVRWWCIKHTIPYPTEDLGLNRYKQEAFSYLTSRCLNKQHLSVISLAANVGATAVLNSILNMENVFKIKYHNVLKFNITNISPSTNLKHDMTKSNERNLGGAASDQKEPQQSLLESVVNLDAPEVAVNILDLYPICLLEHSYSRLIFWIYFLLMIPHLAYMSFLTAVGIPLVNRNANSTGQAPGQGTVYPDLIIFIWPVLCLLLQLPYLMNTIYSFASENKTKAEDSTFFTKISFFIGANTYVITGITFSVIIIVWYVMNLYFVSNQEYALALGLITGWLNTMCFTRGFKGIHHFSRMIKEIIIRDIIRFLTVYFIFLLAFSFAFYALFQACPKVAREYPTPVHAIFLAFNLMLGMGDIFEPTFQENFDEVGRSTVPIKLVYVVYMIMSTILLLNLLIAMMNDSYQSIQTKHETTWRVGAVKLGLEWEKMLPAIARRFNSGSMQMVRQAFTDRTEYWWMLGVPLSVIDAEKDNHPDSSIGHSVDQINHKMNDLESKVDDLNEKMGKILNTLNQTKSKPCLN